MCEWDFTLGGKTGKGESLRVTATTSRYARHSLIIISLLLILTFLKTVQIMSPVDGVIFVLIYFLVFVFILVFHLFVASVLFLRFFSFCFHSSCPWFIISLTKITLQWTDINYRIITGICWQFCFGICFVSQNVSTFIADTRLLPSSLSAPFVNTAFDFVHTANTAEVMVP